MKTLFKTLLSLVLSGCIVSSAWGQRGKTTDEKILAVIKQTTAFMLDELSYKGGFVWEYLPDLSRQWGEMEAYRTMAWTQSDGTPKMGEFFLDLYHATGDEYYYQAAEKVASALIWGQHPSGGWNYCYDFAGEASLRQWYNTIGKNGWRLEEFHHYYGNATYDDDVTVSAAHFIQRLYSERNDPKYRYSVDKTVQFLLESQYPIGGWPQRYPLMYEYSKNGLPDYTSYITFNDDVHKGNVNMLILYYRVLGDKSLIDPILRGMNCVIALQQGMPQPGWGEQYSLDYKPNHARSYEPRSLHSRETYNQCDNLMDYYRITGETKFLARIPEAINWIESLMMSDEDIEKYAGSRATPNVVVCPRFIEIGTDRGLYTDKIGSNVVNGSYVKTYEPHGDLAFLNTNRLRARYNDLIAMPVELATANSPFLSSEEYKFPDNVAMRRNNVKPTVKEVDDLIAKLVNGKYWLVPIETSNPYIGDGGMTVLPVAEKTQRTVGDKYDTSPYKPDPDIMGITTKSYMENVSRLVMFLQQK